MSDIANSTGVTVDAENTREVQLLATRADPGQTIGRGWFRLSLNFEGITDIDPETLTQTELIPHDATAADVKAALETLENINVIEVRRFGPLAQNTFEWKITLDWVIRRGDIPMLDVSQEQLFDVTWDGGSDQIVWVREERKGTLGLTPCVDVCEHTVADLSPGTQYQFRVRAQSAAGWSDFSQASSIIRTHQLAPPGAPQAPRLLSAGDTFLTLSVEMPERRDGGDRALLRMEVQYQRVLDETAPSLASGNLAGGRVATFPGGGGAWQTLPLLSAGASDTVAVTADGLAPDTLYQFRSRAVVAVGTSPWSPLSASLSTTASAPSAPELQSISSASIGFSSVSLTWTRPSGNGAPVSSYDVQFRQPDAPWVAAANTIPAVVDGGAREVQTVTTRTDPGFPITRGSFALSINIEGITDADVETPSKTTQISWDASIEEVEEALERLPAVGNVEVRRSGPSSLGEYEWTITMDWDKPALELRGDLPNLDPDALQLGGRWTGGGGRGVVVREVRAGRKAVVRGTDPDADHEGDEQLPAFTVNGLQALTLYQFRVRAVNSFGPGPWTLPSARVRTTVAPFGDAEGDTIPFGVPHPHGAVQTTLLRDVTLPLPDLPDGSRMLGGQGRFPHAVAMADIDYVAGIGVGSIGAGAPPGDGMIVVHAFTGFQMASVSKSVFHYRDVNVYGDTPQLYTVPASDSRGIVVDHVVVKLWGAGGGGGSTGFSQGGGGGFVQTQLAVRSGDVLALFVGGGGHSVDSGRAGRGGFNGGGSGGNGEWGGAGGGGATSIHGLLREHSSLREPRAAAQEALEDGDTSVLMAIPLVVAAGGGGAGSSDYCCSHGGGGGGLAELDSTAERGVGAPGLSPDDTPRSVDGEPSRYHGLFNDVRDTVGFPPYHTHLDSGYAPESNLKVIALPGVGGSVLDGGGAGASGSYDFAQIDEAILWAQPLDESEAHPDPDTSSNPTAGSGVTPVLQRNQRKLEFEGAISTHPTPGGWGVGGSGGSGKEAGGGGGGGLFGGGGGGAGVDGAGGGGGTSYIHLPGVWVPRVLPGVPAAPIAVQVRSTSVALRWDPVYLNGRLQPATGYIVERAPGSVNTDFKEIHATVGPVTTYVDTGLRPSSVYQYRIRATDWRSGIGSPGPSLELVTAHPPVNTWRQVYAAGVSEARAGGGRRFIDPVTDELNLKPPALQGHSFTPMLGYVFMFGGRSTGYDCELSITEPCRYFDSVNNFLWRLDPVSYRWEQLPAYGTTPGLLPPARERHSASVLGDRLLIFGGRSDPDESGNGGPYLNDLWELNPGAERIITANGSTLSAEGTELNPLEGGDGVPEGRIAVVSAFLEADTSPPDQECVMDVEVWVELHHPCLQELQLSLFGPGPAPFRAPGSAFSLGERLPQEMPRGEESILFVGGTGEGTANKAWACSSTTRTQIPGPEVGVLDNKGEGHTLWFDDNAADPHASCCVNKTDPTDVFRGYMRGRVRPVDALNRFRGLPADGEWRLAIYDPVVNGRQASLISWGIRVHAGPCDKRYRWTKLEPTGGPPPPRYDASVVTIGRNMWVFSGRAESIHNDMWRFNRDDMTWQHMPIPKDPTPIRDPSIPVSLEIPTFVIKPNQPLGRSGVLTPWGVLTFGGRSSHAHHLTTPGVYRWSVLNDRWYTVNPPPPNDRRHFEPNAWRNPNYDASNEDHLYEDLARSAELEPGVPLPVFPHRRLLAGVAFVGEANTRTRLRGVGVPKLLVYGGYNGAAPLNDLWELTLLEVLHEDELKALTNLHPDTGIGVLAAQGDGTQTSTHDITGRGTGNYTMGDKDIPGGPDMDLLWQGHCPYRLVTDSSAEEEWFNGCLGDGTQVCGVDDILLRAWCERGYQSVGPV